MSFRSNNHHRRLHDGRPNFGSHAEYYRDDRFNREEDCTTYVTTVEKKTIVSEAPRHLGSNKHGAAYKHKEVYEEDEVLERGRLVGREVICESERFGCEDEVETEEIVSRKHQYMVKAI